MRWLPCVAMLCGFGLSGCGNQPAVDAPLPKKEADSAGFPRTVLDSFGHTLKIASRPTRIVSTAPSNTEILFAVGAGPQVVGVTTFCNFPAEASQRDKIGGFSPKTISSERMVALTPDLVLTTGRLQQPLTESLRKLGLAVLSYDAQTMEDVVRNVRAIGQATDHTKAAEALAASLDKRRDRVRDRFASLPDAERPGVLILLSEDPLMTSGAKTFGSQMLELAGGRNVFADVDQQFPRVSEEEIIKRNPAVIILWERGDFAARKERLGKRPGWNQLEAFRTGRVLAIEDDLMNRAGPRLFDGLERLADLLHPPEDRGKK